MSLEEDMYNKLNEKVDSHDRTLTLMSKAVEDINSNLDRFANVVEQQSKDMMKHWHNQDKIMGKIENLLESRKSDQERFSKIEDRQLNGCPNFKSFEEKRNLEVAQFMEAKNNLKTATTRNREEIEKLNEECTLQKEKISVANNRIKDLENNQTKGMWLIVGAFIAIIGTLIKTSMGG